MSKLLVLIDYIAMEQYIRAGKFASKRGDTGKVMLCFEAISRKLDEGVDPNILKRIKAEGT